MLTPLTDPQNLTSRFFKESIDENLGVSRFLTADTAVFNTAAFQNIADLSIELPYISDFVFTSTLFYTSPTAAAIQFRFHTNVGINMKVLWGDSTMGGAEGVDVDNLTRSLSTSGSREAIHPTGWIDTQGGRITFGMSFTQSVATAGTTLLNLGSFIRFYKVI